jgi:hypothetical protein
VSLRLLVVGVIIPFVRDKGTKCKGKKNNKDKGTKQKFMPLIRAYSIPPWVYFVLGLGFASSIFFGVYSFVDLKQIPRFIGISEVESGDITDPSFNDVLVSGCTNKTVGIQRRKFTRETVVAHGCPDTRNACSEFVCNEGHICEEIIRSNATCSEDFDCDMFERCDTSTCTCVPDGTTCTSDSQCLNMNMTSECVETFCNIDEGRCKTRFINATSGSCETDNNCEDDFVCRGCLCVGMPEVNVTACSTNSDCTNYAETSMCIESFCNMTTLTCATRFQDISYDCDGSCPSGEICNDCICTTLPSNPECTTAADCVNMTATSECVDVDCVMGQCQTQFIGNATCDGNCPLGQSCQDCQCVPIGFVEIMSGTMMLTGADTINTTYILSGSGNLRRLQWQPINGSGMAAAVLSTGFGFIPVGSRPVTNTEAVALVRDSTNWQIGIAEVDLLGGIDFQPGAPPSPFTADGLPIGVRSGSLTWDITF